MTAGKRAAGVGTQCARAALHAPIRGEPTAPPIPQATAWAFRNVEDADAAFNASGDSELYARLGTPLHGAVERTLAGLEGVEAACLFSTGMAAITAAIDALCPPGALLLASPDLYGTTDTYLNGMFRERGGRVARVDMADLGAVERALADRPAAVLLEVLTNPSLKVLELDRVAALAHAAGALVLVDATFTPPTLLRVAALGADVVHHSASKFLAGHGDVSAGVVAGPRAVVDRVRTRRSVLGAHLGALEAWLLARGLRTLHLRTAAACDNALFLAHRFEHRRAAGRLPALRRVVHPALPGHAAAGWLGRAAGGRFGMMLCIELKDADAAALFVRHLEDIRLVPSLGDVATSVTIPARSSHRGVPPAERLARGITDGLVRISVGVEDPLDVAEDMERALAACPAA
ncbi:MAG: aminotransferase class V-fold PLP-dependent enzyme [Deltaproteobacteria bacterium]|nr:aminotransferase class V-fold PLP-dependent enzyme [Deltaproteobacteria bacterium]